MNKYILILIIFIASTALIIKAIPIFQESMADKLKSIFEIDIDNNSSEDKEVLPKDMIAEYYIDNNKGISIAKVPNARLSMFSQKKSETALDTKEVNDNSETLITINSSYFLENWDHAGLLISNGNKIVNLAPNDKQLTHVVTLMPEFKIISNSDYAKQNTQNGEVSFQSGPLVIEEGTVRYDLIENSFNGNSRHFRSLLGIDSSDNIYIITTNRVYSLDLLAESLLDMEIIDSTLTLINLDGGSSVSAYSSENPNFRFSESRKLPFYVLITK